MNNTIEDILTVVLFLLFAGIFRGLREVIQFRYDNFKEMFPFVNDNFWNPKISWRNKYKNNNPELGEKFYFSTSFLVFLTDGYHLLANLTHLFLALAISSGVVLFTDIPYGFLIGFIYWFIYSLGNGFVLKIFDL